MGDTKAALLIVAGVAGLFIIGIGVWIGIAWLIPTPLGQFIGMAFGIVAGLLVLALTTIRAFQFNEQDNG